MTVTAAQLHTSLRLLKNDRSAFIEQCPQLGIARSVAQAVFGAPRHLDACLWVFDCWARGVAANERPCMHVLAWRSEGQWPMTRGAA